ncbi:hypothetical protein PvtlMGM2_1118, partial [Prevotella sp. MGM2]
LFVWSRRMAKEDVMREMGVTLFFHQIPQLPLRLERK